MKKELSRELLEGSVLKGLIKLSTPTMIGFLFQTGYEIVDMIWIGRISANAIAGVTIFITIYWVVNVLNTIIGNSSISLISQNYGTGSKTNTSIAIEQTLTFKGLVAIIATILMLIILKPTIYFFTSNQEVVKSALDYGYLRLFFLPVLFSSFTVNTAFRCIGEGRKPMIAMFIAALINIILDPILMFDIIPFTNIKGFGMGVFGAGLATVISGSVAFLIAFIMLIRQKDKVDIKFKRMFILNREMDYKLMTIGLPNGMEMLTRQLAVLVTLRLIHVYGTDAVATFGIGEKLFNFAFMPLVGLGMGSSAMIGQALGNEDVDRAEEIARTSVWLGIFVSSVFIVLSMIYARNIMMIFTDDVDIIEMGITMLRFYAPSLWILSVTFGVGSVFGASGYNFPWFSSAFISQWVVHIPILVLVVIVLKLPIVAVWITYLISDSIEALSMYIQYRGDKWKNKRVYMEANMEE